MRMWIGVQPNELCRQHLLGEHNELHKLIGSIRAGHSLDGYLSHPTVLEPQNAWNRHARLVMEMLARGYNHDSPLDSVAEFVPKAHVNRKRSRQDLGERCDECAERMR